MVLQHLKEEHQRTLVRINEEMDDGQFKESSMCDMMDIIIDLSHSKKILDTLELNKLKEGE